MNTPTNQTQGSQDMKANFKPRTGLPFKPSGDNVLTSCLYRANKRPYNPPTNYIGRHTVRPDNMTPVKTYNPAGFSGKYTFQGPVLHTQPVQPQYS